jgi:coenzyme PQQ synthesis protein D (PqqD)
MGDMSRYVNRAGEGKSLVTRRIAGETILVPVAGDVADLDAVYTLNEVGSFIWQLMDGRRSAQAIAGAVSAEYDVTLEQAAQDVDELLTALEAKGLARHFDAPGRNL